MELRVKRKRKEGLIMDGRIMGYVRSHLQSAGNGASGLLPPGQQGRHFVFTVMGCPNPRSLLYGGGDDLPPIDDSGVMYIG